MATRMTTRLIDCDLRGNPSISPQVISCIITARQQSWGKVMFSVMSVCQSLRSQGRGNGHIGTLSPLWEQTDTSETITFRNLADGNHDNSV